MSIDWILKLGAFFVPSVKPDGTRDIGVLPWSLALMVLVSGSCLAQKDEPFSQCTKSFIETVKGIIPL